MSNEKKDGEEFDRLFRKMYGENQEVAPAEKARRIESDLGDLSERFRKLGERKKERENR